MLNYNTPIKEDKSYVDLEIKEIKPIMKLIIRGKTKNFITAIGKNLNMILPTEANTSTSGEALTALWLSPDEWMLLSNKPLSDDTNTYEAEDNLINNISKVNLGAVTDVSDQFVMINIKGNKVFDLSRQGTALLEVTSRKFIINNQKEFEDFLSFLEEVGDSIRESNVEKDSASIRQDINISIKKGEKVEIKGVSSLSGIRQVIVKEIERQEKILPEGYQITPHTRCIDNPSAGTTSFMRPYKGNTRYFSEPELSSYAISLSRIELEKRLLESLIVKRYLNLNLQKEIRARGLLVLLEKLKKMKVKSLLELTIGQISSILRGFTRLNYREVVKKLKDISTFEEARLFLRNSLITCDKKILISIYEKIKLSKENVSLPLLVDLLEKNLITKEEADILFEKYMTLY